MSDDAEAGVEPFNAGSAETTRLSSAPSSSSRWKHTSVSARFPGGTDHRAAMREVLSVFMERDDGTNAVPWWTQRDWWTVGEARPGTWLNFPIAVMSADEAAAMAVRLGVGGIIRVSFTVEPTLPTPGGFHMVTDCKVREQRILTRDAIARGRMTLNAQRPPETPTPPGASRSLGGRSTSEPSPPSLPPPDPSR